MDKPVDNYAVGNNYASRLARLLTGRIRVMRCTYGWSAQTGFLVCRGRLHLSVFGWSVMIWIE